MVPEMKGRSQEEVDRMFALKLGTRKWVKWTEDESGARREEAGKNV